LVQLVFLKRNSRMPLLGICTWSRLRPLFVARSQLEIWDLGRALLFVLAATTSYLCGNALCSLQGRYLWPVALMLQVGGIVILSAEVHVMVMEVFTVVQAYRRCREILQFVILTCIGVGAIASLKRSALMDEMGSTFLVQFYQSFAQITAVFVFLTLGLAMLRIVIINVCRVVHVLSQFYIRAFVRPIQMTVPDLSKEVIGECSICLADLADDDGQGVLRLFCNHTFHIDCIQHWLSKCDACPLCRSGVPTLRSCVHLKQKAIPSQSSPCVSDASTQEPPESIESFDIESSPADMESVDSVFCHMSQTPFPGSEFMENQQSDADSSHAAESQQMSIYGVLPDPPEEEPPAESRRKRKPPKPVRAQRREPEVSTMTATQSDVRRTHVQAAAANFDQIVQWSQEGVSSPDSESL